MNDIISGLTPLILVVFSWFLFYRLASYSRKKNQELMNLMRVRNNEAIRLMQKKVAKIDKKIDKNDLISRHYTAAFQEMCTKKGNLFYENRPCERSAIKMAENLHQETKISPKKPKKTKKNNSATKG